MPNVPPFVNKLNKGQNAIKLEQILKLNVLIAYQKQLIEINKMLESHEGPLTHLNKKSSYAEWKRITICQYSKKNCR